MAFEQLTDNLKGLSDNTQDYVATSAEYYKLNAFKYSMKALTGIATLSIRGVFVLIFLMFFSVGIAFLIGEHMENSSSGFFIVGGFYFLIFILIVAFGKKPLEQLVIEKCSKIVFEEDPDEDISEILGAKKS